MLVLDGVSGDYGFMRGSAPRLFSCMAYRLEIRQFVGGEIRYSLSPFAVNRDTTDITKTTKQSEPEKTRPLLVYSAQLETASGARLSGYGNLPKRLTKFTSAAKKTIQRCARAMDEVAKHPSEILFLTGTLPGTGKEQYRALAEWSSWVVHRLKAWIGKRLAAKLDFYCWELQKRGALHLHYAVHCPDQAIQSEIESEFKSEWIRLLDGVSENTGIDLYQNQSRGFTHRDDKSRVRAIAEKVRSGVGRYLGKYLSKSASKGDSGVFSPCRWYGVSRPLRALEESYRRTYRETYATARDAYAAAETLDRVLDLCSDIRHDWQNKVVPGLGGVAYDVKPETLRELLGSHLGMEMSYSSINNKLRDKWRDLIACLAEIEERNPKWFSAMQRRHRTLSRWPQIRVLSGLELTSPKGLELAQHTVWAYQDLIRDPVNTWRPRLIWRHKNILLYRLSEVEATLALAYEFDTVTNEPQDMNY